VLFVVEKQMAGDEQNDAKEVTAVSRCTACRRFLFLVVVYMRID